MQLAALSEAHSPDLARHKKARAKWKGIRMLGLRSRKRKARKAWKLPGVPHPRLEQVAGEAAGFPGAHSLQPAEGPPRISHAARFPAKGLLWKLRCVNCGKRAGHTNQW